MNLKKLRNTLAKKSDRVSTAGEGCDSDVSQVIPSGIDIIDGHIFGCGGIPCRRVIELYADAGAGKTSIAMQFCGAFQKAGGVAIYIETESALHSQRFADYGCNLDDLIIIQDDSVENVLSLVNHTLDSIDGKQPVIIVWDSLAGTPTDKDQKELNLEKAAVGIKARAMSRALPLIVNKAMKQNATFLIINQIRDKIGAFGDSATTPGGHAAKFFASIRLRLWKSTAVKKGTDLIGHEITVKAEKNKICIPGQKAKIRMIYGEGFDNAWSLVNYGKDAKVLPPRSQPTEENLALVRANLADQVIENFKGLTPTSLGPT